MMDQRLEKAIWAIVILTFTLSGCASNKAFTKRDVRGAQKMMGLSFEDKYVDTMYQYLLRNNSGFDSLRQYEVSRDIQPPLYFDPRPIGFQEPSFDEALSFAANRDARVPANRNDLAFMPISELAHLIKSKQISSLELTVFFLERLKKYDSQLKCVISLTEDYALQKAKEADQKLSEGEYLGLLHGIPYGIKDLFAFKGYPTTWGAMPYKNQTISYNGFVVEKLEAAGAVLVAKLTSGALARGDVWFGGKTKNPWDLSQGASGSSAGSGSAVSAGLVPFALGTETLGSITSPATRNGVTGLRPSYGRVSKDGVMSLSWTMDKIGPLARNAEDCGIILNVISGYDANEPSTTKVPLGSFNKPLEAYRIGYFKADFEKDTTAVGRNNMKVLEAFRDHGYELEELALPKGIPYPSFDIILRAEAGAFFDDMVRKGGVNTMVQQTQRSRANSLRQSRFIPAVEYIQANRHRMRLIQEFHKVIEEYDIVLSPTFGSRQLLTTNLTGHPVVCLPNGFDEKHRPTSFTIIGNLYDEGTIIKMAKAFQEWTDFEEKKPPLFSK